MYGCEKSNTLVASDREEVIDVRKRSRKVPKVPEETKKNKPQARTKKGEKTIRKAKGNRRKRPNQEDNRGKRPYQEKSHIIKGKETLSSKEGNSMQCSKL